MMKLTIVNATLSHGGAERVISIIANYLAAKKYDITILTWLDSPIFYKIENSVIVYSIEKECKSSNLFKKMIWFRRYISKHKPDLLLSFLAIFNIVTLISLLGLGIKIIVCERNDPRYTPFGKTRRLIRNLVYHLADGILTQTDNNKAYFSTLLQKKTKVIYNPIFLNIDYIGKALLLPHDKTIISVARLEPQKNQLMLIDAFAEFEKMNPQYNMIILGEGNYRNILEQRIRELGLSEKIYLPGVVYNVFDYLSKAQFFVLSSNFEGMPNTLLEAMCIGLPCISTKVSGAIDLIEDGKNGFLVDIGDNHSMAIKMNKIANDIELQKSLGKTASKLYEQLNVNVICKEWESYINSMISK